MKKPSKQELLQQYSQRNARRFVVFDGFYDEQLDEDGFFEVPEGMPQADAISTNIDASYELMGDTGDVRIVIPQGTSRDVALRLLEKLTETVRSCDWDAHFQLSPEEQIDASMDELKKLISEPRIHQQTDKIRGIVDSLDDLMKGYLRPE